MRKRFFITWVVVILVAGGAAVCAIYNVGIFFGISNIQSIPTQVPAKVTDHSEKLHGMKMTSDSSDQERYDKIKGEYFDLVNSQSPAEALALVEKRVETDSWLMNHCHPLVHEIGHVAYKKYQDINIALKYQDGVCNSGYLHGVIEEYFANTEDVFAAMQTMCKGLDLGRCYHGMGHGLMYYTANNLPKSLDFCSTLKGGDAVAFCAQGVFMENFNTDLKLHPSEYLDPKDPFIPCTTQKNQFKLSCYYYAPTFYLAQHNDDYTAGLAWCNNAEGAYQGTCTRGISSRATKTHINDLLWVENLCIKGSARLRPDCIDGMIGFYINHYDSTEKGRTLCATLREENQPACYKGISNRESIFQMQD